MSGNVRPRWLASRSIRFDRESLWMTFNIMSLYCLRRAQELEREQSYESNQYSQNNEDKMLFAIDTIYTNVNTRAKARQLIHVAASREAVN